MAEKPELIDVISEATRQHRRRAMPIDIDPLPGKGGPAKERSRMAHTPPRLERWRDETLTPWKITLKSWKFIDWD
ncbi:MAG TPA: hypothetical protein VNJ49_12180 [Bradyrhizobium sp.]|nr:hypothetical protein [Bradyrhizobium sp.]